jgi:multimeric flavodoxin WrbA
MSKILILVGSVRKNGNTELLANAFKQGAEKHNSVEIISVADYKINPCVGCEYCQNSDGNVCVQNDDMKIIYEKLKECDTLVIASPVYFYGISAQLKALIDRLHTPMRNTFSVKNMALLLVAGASLPQVFDSILVQYNLVLSYFKLNDLGKVLVTDVRQKGAIKDNKALLEAYNLGMSIN